LASRLIHSRFVKVRHGEPVNLRCISTALPKLGDSGAARALLARSVKTFRHLLTRSLHVVAAVRQLQGAPSQHGRM
jgi:hypothetical protein